MAANALATCSALPSRMDLKNPGFSDASLTPYCFCGWLCEDLELATTDLEQRGNVEKRAQVGAVVLCPQLLERRVKGQRPPHHRERHLELTGNMRQVIQPLCKA